MPKKKILKPKLVVFDFDGVFTNNKVIVSQDGTESVVCDRSDGLGLEMLRRTGMPILILSKELNPVVTARAKKLKLPVIQGIDHKLGELRKYCFERKISLKDVLYVGNDINDLEPMKNVGMTACPKDSHKRILKMSQVVLTRNGGDGAIRELVEEHLGVTEYE